MLDDNKLQKLKAPMLPSSFAPILYSMAYIHNGSCVITDAIYFTLKPRDPACVNTQTMYDNGAQITPQPYFQSALKVVASGWNKWGTGELWVAVGPWGKMEHGRSFAWPVLVWYICTLWRGGRLRMQRRWWRGGEVEAARRLFSRLECNRNKGEA